jgi:FMN phosphatase YigB (HAD superfamily)
MENKVKPYIACDIGNVCVHINRPKFIAAIKEYLLVDESKVWQAQEKMEVGAISGEEFLEEIKLMLKPNTLSVEDIRKHFYSILDGVIDKMEELFLLLEEKNVNVVFLSDISPLHLDAFRKIFPIACKYEGVYSFEVAGFKPNKEMFGTLIEKYGKPLFYVDDRKDLITAAQKENWNTCLYTSVDSFIDKLKSIGIME